LASVVVVVSNACPPTLNRTRPPAPGLAAIESTDRALHRNRSITARPFFPIGQPRIDRSVRETGQDRDRLALNRVGNRVGIYSTSRAGLRVGTGIVVIRCCC
jgi:hypothetical protein